MSEPVTNVEIEDVLSSIRKLVSTKPQGDEGRADEATQVSSDQDNRLVLTPSLRVDDDVSDPPSSPLREVKVSSDAPEESAEPFAETIESEEGEAERHAHSENAPAADDPVDEAESDDGGDGPSLEGSEDTTTQSAAETDDPAPNGRSGSSSEAETVDPQDETDTTEWSAEDEAADDTAETDGHENDTGDQTHEYEYFEGDDEHDEELNAAETAETAHDDPFEGEDQADEMAEADTGGAGPVRDDLTALEARIAGFEAAVNAKQDQWEPDGDSDDDYSGSRVEPLPWQDHTPEGEAGDAELAETFEAATVSPTFVHDATGADDIPQTNESDVQDVLVEEAALLADEAVLDEDMLRDMVAEIVRQELQGTLGERITRNVRKLVRREIHRALASQDFD